MKPRGSRCASSAACPCWRASRNGSTPKAKSCCPAARWPSDHLRTEPVGALTTYTTQGFLNIDNNASERALKRVALGRKNWLFAGHDAAAENHARLWSLIATCDRHALDPQRYLTSLLAKIGTTPADELDQFLPDVWKVEDAGEPLRN